MGKKKKKTLNFFSFTLLNGSHTESLEKSLEKNLEKYLFIGDAAYLYWPNPPDDQDVRQGQFSLRNLTGLNSEFFFSLTGWYTKFRVINLPYNLPIAGRRIVEFILLSRVITICEILTTSFRIWSRLSSPFPTRITITAELPLCMYVCM